MSMIKDDPYKILLVDDDKDDAYIFQDYFLNSFADTIEVDVAIIPQEIHAPCYDAILIDYSLGAGLTGLDVAKQIRAGFPRKPIVLLTAFPIDSWLRESPIDFVDDVWDKQNVRQVREGMMVLIRWLGRVASARRRAS